MRIPGATPCLLAWLIAWSSAPGLAASFDARVVGVSDGDTITVLDAARRQHKVRLAGIDAPEKTQAFGQAAKRHLSDLAYGRNVTLDCLPKPDRYQRLLCVVQVAGQDANLAQIRAGYAWWYRAYAREQTPERQSAYAQAEDSARAGRRGLWRDPEPEAPWDYRHAKRSATSRPQAALLQMNWEKSQ